jgi:hypothetical protein
MFLKTKSSENVLKGWEWDQFNLDVKRDVNFNISFKGFFILKPIHWTNVLDMDSHDELFF